MHTKQFYRLRNVRAGYVLYRALVNHFIVTWHLKCFVVCLKQPSNPATATNLVRIHFALVCCLCVERMKQRYIWGRGHFFINFYCCVLSCDVAAIVVRAGGTFYTLGSLSSNFVLLNQVAEPST